MSNKLKLHIPTIDELWYRQKLLADKETMSYNKGYNLDFAEYDNETGCIEFPKEKWNDWYNWFVKGEPDRFYAYIMRTEDNEFIGDVNLHSNNLDGCYEMGIVLESKHRGQGYAVDALKLLLEYAFDKLNAHEVRNDFEATRISAVKTHINAGFSVAYEKDGITHLVIKRVEI